MNLIIQIAVVAFIGLVMLGLIYVLKNDKPPVCGSFARQLEIENAELRFLLKNPSRKQRLRRHRLNK